MQLKFFTITDNDNGAIEKELNSFLSSRKVLEVITNFNPSPNGGSWHICVKYIEGSAPLNKSNSIKVDYKELLTPEVFNIFSKLRAIRKQIATEEAVPAYVVFTDDELASIAGLQVISSKSLLSINGVGEKKIEKYGNRLVEMLNNSENDQANWKPVVTNS
jgi:superfamily II DNA helicase RecQ